MPGPQSHSARSPFALRSLLNEQVSAKRSSVVGWGFTCTERRKPGGCGGAEPAGKSQGHQAQPRCPFACEPVVGPSHIIHLSILAGPQEPVFRRFGNVIFLTANAIVYHSFPWQTVNSFRTGVRPRPPTHTHARAHSHIGCFL